MRNHLARLVTILLIVIAITGTSAMAFASHGHSSNEISSEASDDGGFVNPITNDLSATSADVPSVDLDSGGNFSGAHDGMDRSPHGTC